MNGLVGQRLRFRICERAEKELEWSGDLSAHDLENNLIEIERHPPTRYVVHL